LNVDLRMKYERPFYEVAEEIAPVSRMMGFVLVLAFSCSCPDRGKICLD
jgi:hypothetical protein